MDAFVFACRPVAEEKYPLSTPLLLITFCVFIQFSLSLVV